MKSKFIVGLISNILIASLLVVIGATIFSDNRITTLFIVTALIYQFVNQISYENLYDSLEYLFRKVDELQKVVKSQEEKIKNIAKKP